MAPKGIIDLEPKREPSGKPALLVVLAALLVAAFGVLLLVGFDNVLALLRYRVTLFLLLGPLLLLFIWCVWMALKPRN